MLLYGFLISSLVLAVLSHQTTTPLPNHGTTLISANDLFEVLAGAQEQYYLKLANVKSVSELTKDKIRQVFNKEYRTKELSDDAEKVVQDYIGGVLENLKNHKHSEEFQDFVEKSDYVKNLTDDRGSKLKAYFGILFFSYTRPELMEKEIKRILKNKPRKCSPELDRYIKNYLLTCEGETISPKYDPMESKMLLEMNIEGILKFCNLKSIDEVQLHHVRQMLNAFIVNLDSLSEDEEKVVNEYAKLALKSFKDKIPFSSFFSLFVKKWEVDHNIPQENLANLKASFMSYKADPKIQSEFKKLALEVSLTLIKKNQEHCKKNPDFYEHFFRLNCDGNNISMTG